MFTISAPAIGFYFIDNFTTDVLHLPDASKILYIFNSNYSLFRNSWLDISYAVAVACVALVGIGFLTVHKIEREIHGIERESGIRKYLPKHKEQDY